MGKFFVDPYKKYNEVLSGATNITSDCAAISSAVSSASGALSGLSSSLSSSDWKELGIEAIASSTLPALTANVDVFQSNIDGVLKEAASQAIGSLLPETDNLKQEDAKYEEITNALNSLVVPVQYDEDGEETALYRSYLQEKERLEKEQSESEKKCLEYQQNCDNIANAIKALDGLVADFKEVTVTTSTGSEETVIERIDGVGDGTMYKISINGKEFLVANTKTDLFEYEAYLQKNGIYQSTGFKSSNCDVLSQQIAVDLLKGTMTSKSYYASSASSPASRINNACVSQSEDEVLEFVYQEVSQGRPVTLQVTQKRSNEGLRHWVTVVGYSSTVESSKDLTPDNILVLDCVDGKVQTLSERNRKLFNQGGKGYKSSGATQTFLNKEVYKVQNV